MPPKLEALFVVVLLLKGLDGEEPVEDVDCSIGIPINLELGLRTLEPFQSSEFLVDVSAAATGLVGVRLSTDQYSDPWRLPGLVQ